jgi:hypothetical protein
MARTYYRVVTSRAFEMAGAGLGYDETYGDSPRFFWDRAGAEARAAELNESGSRDLRGTYAVEEGRVYDDGRFDDEDSAYAREQLFGEDA